MFPLPGAAPIREALLDTSRERGSKGKAVAGDVQSGAGQTRPDCAPHRSPAAHDHRQAGADFPNVARSGRAWSNCRRDLARVRTRLGSTIAELWGSNEVRAVQPTVMDELQAGLIHFRSTIVQTIPLIYRDLEEAVAEVYPGRGRLGAIVPHVWDLGRRGPGRQSQCHARTDAEALRTLRNSALDLLDGKLLELAGRLSLSTHVAGDAPQLRELLGCYGEMFPDLAADLAHRNTDELYRQAVTFMRERVRAARRDQLTAISVRRNYWPTYAWWPTRYVSRASGTARWRSP